MENIESRWSLEDVIRMGRSPSGAYEDTIKILLERVDNDGSYVHRGVHVRKKDFDDMERMNDVTRSVLFLCMTQYPHFFEGENHG